MSDLQNTPGSGAAKPWVLDTNDASFEFDVIEKSNELPVVLDFWSRDCQPCLMLAPILEELAEQRDGQFLLVKAETRFNQHSAAQFRVSSIPAIFGLYGGQVVDSSVGLLSPEQAAAWVDALINRRGLVEAILLLDKDAAAAEAKFREVDALGTLGDQPKVGLARALFMQGKADEVSELIEKLERRGFLEPELEKVKAGLELQSGNTGDLAALQAKAASDEGDLATQLELARAYAAASQYNEAMDVCLKVVAADKTGAGDDARQIMVDIFRVHSDADVVRDYRKRLSSLLF